MTFLNQQKIDFSYPILTMGTFDGLHRGHQKVLKKLFEVSQNKGEAVVLSYYHHPLETIHKKTFPYLLLERDLKESCLKKMGIKNVLFLNFSKKIASMSAENFLKRILIDEIGMKEIVVGYDTHFGKNREGNLEFLKKMRRRFNYKVHFVKPLKHKNVIISSSLIRDLVREGNIQKTNRLLGRNYSMLGKVIEGQKIGNKIGFPTINIQPKDKYKLIPGLGVYITVVEVENNKYRAVTNIGYSPTLKKTNIKEIETYIINFSANLYDKEIKLNFYKKIREEIQFNHKNQLIAAIRKDVKTTQNYFDNC